jgi:ABC-type Fe3+/spermidine/putrescine transport system ATPase subunit
VAVLRDGQIVQHGSSAHIHARPADEAAAHATGAVNIVPINIRGGLVESPIGSWEIGSAPFQGTGVALVRPEEFSVAAPGQDSDLIFGIEEASFAEGRWLATGFVTGGLALRVALPPGTEIHKGKLLPLRYDGSRFRVIRREGPGPAPGVPTDIVPPLGETR